MNAPILIPRTHINSVPPIGCLFGKGSGDSFQSARLDGPCREGSRFQGFIITPASEVPFRAAFEIKRRLISERQKDCAGSDLAACRGMLLSRSGVTIGDTENDVTMGEEKRQINYCPFGGFTSVSITHHSVY